MRIPSVLLCLGLAVPALAQQPLQIVQPQKQIDVQGQAEREITPNEIWFAISLREYKDGSRKVDIDVLEKQLVGAVANLKIPRENLRIDNVSSWQNYWDKKRNTEFLASKRYLLKLTDLQAINPLLDRVDARGIESTAIQHYTHTDIEQMRQELQIQALQNARAKAQGLVAAVGQRLGTVLQIHETGLMTEGPQPYENRMLMKATMDDGAPAEIDFKTIKLRAEIRAIWAIE